MSDYRLFTFDLDGTLLTSEKEITDRTRAVLQAAHEKGILLVPSTGRFFDGLPTVVRELPFIRYAITINGEATDSIAVLFDNLTYVGGLASGEYVIEVTATDSVDSSLSASATNGSSSAARKRDCMHRTCSNATS